MSDHRHDLPIPLTSFVGRDAELGALAGALGAARLVSVVGPGGCGKTRLALEVATREQAGWPDGVCWVDLAATGDPVVIPELIAAAAGVVLAAEPAAVASLTRQIGARRMLLCLDNCEHVLSAVADVAIELVRACPGVTMLATSREPVGIAGEVVWRVPPLTGDDAVALFADRAVQSADSAVQPADSAVQPADSAAARAAVRTACARLDGIPLAIELAAAWSGTLSAQEILRGLDDRFALLIRGPRGVAARHQTLAASMAWSHDLLTEADRVLFRRLGAFHGGFTLETAGRVCGFDGLDRAGVLDGLRRLVDKSLVSADTRGAVARYRMLETIRQYAVARLAASADAETVPDRHLDTFLALAEAAAPLLDQDKDAWRSAIEAEQENLRAALDRGLSAADPERGRRLAAALPWLWHLSRYGHDGLTTLHRAIDRRPTERSELQARLLTGLALVADTTRPLGLEYDAAQAALEIAAEVGDARSACLARLLSAVGSFYQDFDAGWSLAEAAREQAGEVGDGFVTDGATALMGIIRHLRDEHEEAVPLLRTAVDGLTRRRDRGVASTALGFLACSMLYAGDLVRARELATEAVRMARPLADYHRVGSAAGVLATVAVTAGQLDAAAAALEPAIRLVEGAGSAPFVPGLARAVGHLHLRAGRPEQAISWFKQEADWVDGDTEIYLAPPTMTMLVAALRAAGSLDTAARVCERALAEARRLGMPRVVADALEQSAYLATEPNRAEDLHHEALAIRAGHGLWLYCVDSLEAIAGRGSDVEAVRLLGAADRARSELGYPAPAADPDVHMRLRTMLGAETYDAAWADGRALDLRDAIGYARRARGKRGRPSTGWASLTPTEQTVVRLAADGLSNPDIGARLFMSRSTVKAHLSHIYAKLGVSNRTELATVASPHLTAQ